MLIYGEKCLTFPDIIDVVIMRDYRAVIDNVL
jgi:hypothetical protein